MPEDNLVSWVLMVVAVIYLHYVAIREAFQEMLDREYEYIQEERREK